MAGTKSWQAKSRLKMLNRMERLAPPAFLLKPSFQFKYSPLSAAVVLNAEDLVVGYGTPLFPKLDFKLMNGSRVALTGFNGIGKTTLLKTFIGELPQLSGTCRLDGKAAAGYFEQDLKWEDDKLTPLKYITEMYPKLTQKEVRSKLASCGVKAEHAEQPISTLSGGEQAKVKLCGLIIKPCSLLLLDEPTNHLDAETKEAFQAALKKYPGSVILVSHDKRFYNEWADTVFSVESLRNTGK
jgi:ATPase subunit of ABC transporter with duplicated ATPase domains